MASLTLHCFIFTAFFILLYLRFKDSSKYINPIKLKYGLIILFVFIFIFKLYIAYTRTYSHGDFSTFKYWASLVHDLGYQQVYKAGVFLDYPPGYLYILDMFETLRLFFHLDTASVLYNCLLKLPSILADLACGAFILSLCFKEKKYYFGIITACLYMFAPAIWTNSSVWGQIDSFYTMFLVGSLYLLYKNKVLTSCFVYALTILIKPQALLFGPLFLFFLIEKKDWKLLLKALLVGFLSILLISLPFTHNFNFTWLIKLYQDTMNYYAYFTVNAFNLYSLFGLNFIQPSTLVMSCLTIFSILLSVVVSAFIYFKSKHPAKLFLSSTVLMFSIFMLAPKMHERYLFPVLYLCLISFILIKDKRLLYTFFGLNFIHVLNVMTIFNLKDKILLGFNPTLMIIAILHLLVYVYLLYITYQIIVRDKIQVETKIISIPSFSIKKHKFSLQKSKVFTRFTKKDLLCLIVIMLLYGSFSLNQLGSKQTANTYWQAPQIDTAFIIELKEASPVESIYFLTGIGNPNHSKNTFQVGLDLKLETSDDLLTWDPLLDLDDAYVYEWVISPTPFEAKYVRISSTSNQSVLNEIGFKKVGSDEFIQVAIIENEGSPLTYPFDPHAVIDEQNLIPFHPTYYNSTYFDEIYHARTGYEILNGYHAYENTHPPLGKIFIAAGISIFGMNPFGWRIAGVFFGILMLPFLYLLLHKMFNRTVWAAGGTFIFAFDFMHFTQSRIATIDTYAVFFTLAMFYFMFQYFVTSFYDTSFSKTLRLLLYSAIFMGLGIASKWTVVYGAVGLAILFFINFIRRSLEYYQVLQYQKAKLELSDAQSFVLTHYKKRAIITMAWCCLCFIALPCLIYYASYIPFLNVAKDNYQFADFIKEQINMFSYHYSLDSSHPFSSPWWQWPLMIRPIWYSITDAATTGNGMISTIVAFGNPAIWWGSIFSLFTCMRIGYLKKDRNALFILIAFLAAYLPWVLVPRITFIYHYYTTVPFLVLSLIYVFKYYHKLDVKNIRWFFGFIVLVFLLFIFFYPALSGSYVLKSYVDNFLHWLPSWYF